MMSEPISTRLPDGRLHLQHGPIDLIIEAVADDAREIDSAYEQASMRFSGLLPSMVGELKLLRSAIKQNVPMFADPVAQRMARAVWHYREQFITPMAAVAGAVADEVLQALTRGRDLRRAYVNNGGDIALHLANGEQFDIGIAGVEDARMKGQFCIHADDPIRGVATSGWRGRSFSLGIADSVTVLAANAAQADAAATMIANAVNIDHPQIVRVPANEISPESDLGEMLVTRHVPMLDQERVVAALNNGVHAAEQYLAEGLLERAVLRLQGRVRVVSKEKNYPTSGPLTTASFPSRKGDKRRRESNLTLTA